VRNILVVDLESTCYKSQLFPPGERSEIIEIGYSALDLSDGHTIDSGSIYVRNIESKISPYCIELTGITQDLLDKEGVAFQSACTAMSKFKAYPWISFGSDDEEFKRQCLERGIMYPLSFEHYNLKDMVNDGFKELIRMHWGATKTFGLKDALHLFGMAFVGRQHSGKDDAINAGRLVWKLSSMMDKDMIARISADGNLLKRKLG